MRHCFILDNSDIFAEICICFQSTDLIRNSQFEVTDMKTVILFIKKKESQERINVNIQTQIQVTSCQFQLKFLPHHKICRSNTDKCA